MITCHNLARSVNPFVLSSGVAAGLGDVQIFPIDRWLDRAVFFFVTFGAISAGGGGQIKVQSSNDNGVADPYTDVASSGQTFTSANSGQAFISDLYQPQKRYLQLVITRNAVANTTIASVVALVYHLFQAPEAPGTNVAQIVWLANSANGAA